MKKLVIILITAAAIFAITGCPDDYGSSGNFWAQDIKTRTFYRVNAEKLAENTYCEVWVEKGSGVTSATANAIATEYSTNIYTKMMNTFGWQADIPLTNGSTRRMNTMQFAHALATNDLNSAKLTILLLDIKDGYKQRGDPYVAGYFYAYDFFDNDPSRPQKSNKRDMIYMDTYPADPTSPDSYETLAHEMQHLMNFVSSVQFRLSDDSLDLMETWVDEGLASAAQWVYSGEYSLDRLANYNKDPSGLIAKGNNFYIWDNHDGEHKYSNLDDYATVYIFFQWLRLQANTSSIYGEIIKSEFYDYKAITNVANSRIDSRYNNNNWALLLRDWLAANYTNATTGLYGYKNDDTLKNIKAPMLPVGINSVDLFPGEGVYSQTNTAETLPTSSANSNIKYAGLSSTGTEPNNTTGFVDGARLTYNVNTMTLLANGKEVPAERGETTGIAPPAPPPSANISAGRNFGQIGSNNFFDSFKVDVGYFWKDRNSGIYDRIKSAINENGGGSINSTIKFAKSKAEKVLINE